MKRPQRFMVVDDDPIVNMLCERMIKMVFEDTEIKLFQNPEIALEFIEREYDSDTHISTILFLDINMPMITGWDFLDHFKNLDERIHHQFTIYLLSSSVDQRDKDKANAYPLVSGFFSKPLLAETLYQICPRPV